MEINKPSEKDISPDQERDVRKTYRKAMSKKTMGEKDKEIVKQLSREYPDIVSDEARRLSAEWNKQDEEKRERERADLWAGISSTKKPVERAQYDGGLGKDARERFGEEVKRAILERPENRLVEPIEVEDTLEVIMPTRAELLNREIWSPGQLHRFWGLAEAVSGRVGKSDYKHFLKKHRYVVRNRLYRMMFAEKGRSIVYEYLWANLVRKGWRDTPRYPLKKMYYDKGLLAHASSYRKVGEECFLDKNTVGTILNEFHKLGIIRLRSIKPAGRKFYQFVAVLGYWEMGKDPKTDEDKPRETYYLDDVFHLPAADEATVH